ncbi:uncharacterized protein Z518_04921 [Rhinocladiella mackenziei CBS 650.93]|uniref:Uncharacterized protein n=1 Tax=Rhinocladiella mackenziei CBS 650.93 TaxID=1442369 RepID=A0A0D2JCU6_9EURO|nr:uncharacterized protein Z518_04921 [Rhinocladiella mackenziei CBS 650.93]KIX06945.1 hypothetical protein Z518_04921 [Rhinocladiella mackenziei CBS 650.93]
MQTRCDSLRIGNRAGCPSSTVRPEPKAKTTRPKNTKQAHSLTYSPQFSADKIKETDPQQIKLLWREVMASQTPPYARPTTASQLRSPAPGNSPGLPQNAHANRTPTNSSTTVSRTGTSRTQGARNATVRDVDFEEIQLIPRGVEIYKHANLSVGVVSGAHNHFGSDKPSDFAKSREFYRAAVQEALVKRAEQDIDDSIFLSMDSDFVKFVQRAYRRLGEAHYSEAEFKIYAWQNLFIGQQLIIIDDIQRQLCAVRLAEVSLKPRETISQRMWYAPPLLSNQTPSKLFGFDIYADSQYWLSNKVINVEYRRFAKQVVHCNASGAFCPYFSIEFKAGTDDSRVVQNQVAAAGLISLFNRCQLKLDAYSQTVLEQFKSQQFNLVRHYGLTMEKDLWIVRVFEPKIVNGAWAGCTIRVLDHGSCLEEEEVVGLLQWINEIHRWGLCEYALGCEDDIKQILSRGSTDLRISATGS